MCPQVRNKRTDVNVENVHDEIYAVRMAKEPEVTEKFRNLRVRAGMSMEQLALALGYRGRSSLQRYENPAEFTRKVIPLEIANKLAKVLVGNGEPPIELSDVMELAGLKDKPDEKQKTNIAPPSDPNIAEEAERLADETKALINSKGREVSASEWQEIFTMYYNRLRK